MIISKQNKNSSTSFEGKTNEGEPYVAYDLFKVITFKCLLNVRSYTGLKQRLEYTHKTEMDFHIRHTNMFHHLYNL